MLASLGASVGFNPMLALLIKLRGSSSTEKEHFFTLRVTLFTAPECTCPLDHLISITGICSLTGHTPLFPISQNTAADAKYNRRCQETRRPFTASRVLKLGRGAGVRTVQSKQKSLTGSDEQLKSV